MLIPKILHHVWLGSTEIPPLFNTYWNTWKNNHPDWLLYTWNDTNIHQFFPLQNQNQYDISKLIGTKKEILCFEILYKLGGIYVDYDFESYKPIEPLIEDAVAFAGWQDGACINTAIIGCTIYNSDMQTIINGIPESFAIPNNTDCGLAGPVYLTKMYPKLVNFTTISNKYLYPYTWLEEYKGKDAYPEAYAAHHWSGMGWNLA